MKCTPVYIDKGFSGRPSLADAPEIGIPAEGMRTKRNPAGIPLALFPLVTSVAFFVYYNGVQEERGLGTVGFAIFISLVVMAFCVVGSLLLKDWMDTKADVDASEMFTPELLGVSMEQRGRLLTDVETAKIMRDQKLNSLLCGRLREIHRDATWLKDHETARGTPEFVSRQQRIASTIELVSDDVFEAIQGVENEQHVQD